MFATHQSMNPQEAIHTAIDFEKKGLLESAEKIYIGLIEKGTSDKTAFIRLGHLFIKTNRSHQAKHLFEQLHEAIPNSPDALFGLAMSCFYANQNEEALRHYQQLTALQPQFDEGHRQLGILYLKLQQPDKALECFLKTRDLAPGSHMAYGNLGDAYRDLNKMNEAIDAYEHSLRLFPNNPEGHFNLSFALLSMGEFKKGFSEYEHRLQSDYWNNSPYHRLNKPLWKAHRQKQETIFCYEELGFGDTLQFIRFLPLLKDKGHRIIFKGPPQLKTLLLSSELGIDDYLDHQNFDSLDFDSHLPLHSLPERLELKPELFSKNGPYLKGNPTSSIFFAKEEGSPARPKIGLAWKGNPQEARSQQKSIPLTFILQMTQSFDAHFCSLQYNDELPADSTITPFPEQIRDFKETADYILNMDLIITIDSVIAHLACALGKPCWVLLSDQPYWTWMQEGGRTPWYPTAILIRKSTEKNWGQLLDAVASSLQQHHFN